MLFKKFRTPYLDADDGANLGGGAVPPDPTPTPEPAPEPQGGNEPAPEPGPQSIKIKFNHQELELPYDEAVTHIQKGMNYDKAVERARQEAAQQARDAYIAEQGYSWKGRPIATEAEYKAALEEQEIENMIQSRGYDPAEIAKIVASHPDVKRASEYLNKQDEQSRQAQAEKERAESIQKENIAFLDAFKKENGREFDFDNDLIPGEVIRMNKEGVPLNYAYAQYLVDHNRANREATQANEANANASTGSVKGHGTPTGGGISRETFEANRNDTEWVNKHFPEIIKSPWYKELYKS